MAAGLGRERLISSHLRRWLEGNEPIKYPMVSVCFLPLCGCRPLAKAIHPSASASGLFPLWLRAPRFVCAALSSQSRLLATARGGSCLGEGRNPSPSSGSSSFLRSPPIAQPPSSFSLVYVGVSL